MSETSGGAWRWWSSIFRRQYVSTSVLADYAKSWAQKRVTPDAALQLSTAWACTRLNARTIGALPREVYAGQKNSKVRTPVPDHPLYGILHDSPNADQTAMEFWEGMGTSLNIRGNAYAEKNFGAFSGQLVGLTPLPTDDVQAYRAPDGSRRFKIAGTGSSANDLGEDRVFHLRGFGAGGLTGLSPIDFGRQTLGSALAADENAARTFNSGLQLAGFIEMDTGVKLKEGQRQEIVELFDKFSLSDRPGKFMPLDPGMKFAPLGMKPSDAQLLETRQFNVEEICRWYGVPPILIGHAALGQTMFGSGVTQIMLAWLALGLGAELERIEQAIEKQLLTTADRGNIFIEHNVDVLLRTDPETRSRIQSTQAQNGLRNRNELRANDNFPPLPGGDALTAQSNLVPLDQLGKVAGGSDQQARSAMTNWLFGGDPASIIADAVATAMRSAIPPPTEPAKLSPPRAAE